MAEASSTFTSSVDTTSDGVAGVPNENVKDMLLDDCIFEIENALIDFVEVGFELNEAQ